MAAETGSLKTLDNEKLGPHKGAAENDRCLGRHWHAFTCLATV
jgi:hypothetical protein